MLKRYLSLALACALVCVNSAAPAFTQGNEFQVRYKGGNVETKIKPDDWKNTISVSSDKIVLTLKDGQVVPISPDKVTGLSYGRKANRRIGTYAALSFISPLFALGMLKKNKQHFVGIEYETADGKKGGVLLQAKNDHYRSLLTALKGVTGREVETEEKLK